MTMMMMMMMMMMTTMIRWQTMLILSDTVITFHINAVSSDLVKKVRAELRRRVTTDALTVVPLVHDVIPRLNPQVLADIARLQSSSVHIHIGKWKKRSEVTQTLRAGCSKAEPKMFAPPQTPLPGARDGQNLISWRWSLPSPTDPVWWRSMYAISSYRCNS